MKPLLFLLFFILNTPTVLALSDTESAIVTQIDKQLPAAKLMLEKVVNINSGTLNLAGVKAVGDEFTKAYQELGFSTQWIDGSEFERAGHLVATYGHQGPKILLIGHLDTVFAKLDPFQRYTPFTNNQVAGPGITDMKGGNVIMLEALRALKALNLLDSMQIKVVHTGNEESSGKPLTKSKKALIDAGIWADIALGFEDGDSNIKTAVIARRGASSWTLKVAGNAAHSSQIFTHEVGYGAVFEAARILDQFRQQLAGVGNLTFNPGLILGGTQINQIDKQPEGSAFGKMNVVAQSLLVKGDIRSLSHQELDSAKNIMQKIVADNLPQTEASIEFDAGYPPMAPKTGNKKLLALYSTISQELGYGSVLAVNPRKAGAADISFVADHVDMALDGLGLMGSGGHTKDEVADMDSFDKNMHKAAILLHRLSSSPSD